jgi:hypothetical protein
MVVADQNGKELSVNAAILAHPNIRKIKKNSVVGRTWEIFIDRRSIHEGTG